MNIVNYEFYFADKIHNYSDVYTFCFKSEQPLPYTAGQYIKLELPSFGSRYFSLASAPCESMLMVTTHIVEFSEYKLALMNLMLGDKVMIQVPPIKPFPLHSNSQAIFIAQGVGIAPFRSILRDLAVTKSASLNTNVLHIANNTHAYRSEIKKLADSSFFTNSLQDFSYKIEQIVKDAPESFYYISGSQSFVEETVESLERYRIPKLNIMYHRQYKKSSSRAES